METLIIKPKDKAELNFFLDLAKRLGTTTKTYEEMQDEQLLKAMEQNMKTRKTDKMKVLDTLENILNDEQAPYNPWSWNFEVVSKKICLKHEKTTTRNL